MAAAATSQSQNTYWNCDKLTTGLLLLPNPTFNHAAAVNEYKRVWWWCGFILFMKWNEARDRTWKTKGKDKDEPEQSYKIRSTVIDPVVNHASLHTWAWLRGAAQHVTIIVLTFTYLYFIRSFLPIRKQTSFNCSRIMNIFSSSSVNPSPKHCPEYISIYHIVLYHLLYYITVFIYIIKINYVFLYLSPSSFMNKQVN